MEIDNMHHIGYHTGEDLVGMFGDVRVILLGGSADRMRAYSSELARRLDVKLPYGTALTNICRSDRYEAKLMAADNIVGALVKWRD